MNLLNILRFFNKGEIISNPSQWKFGQLAITILASIILIIVNILAVFGYSLPVDTEAANAISVAIITIANLVLTVVTTDKIGLNPNKQK